ncbi:MAG: SRPBCC family protein [Gammaproteobacteria bacterium]|nr:SRPBCC family protein [Gammaproteobacteria bacterium]
MTISVSEKINAPRERVWTLITDPDSWAENISGIKSVEVLEKPASGFVGLKWREKREFFGKEATETMWVTSAETGHWYETNALNHGMAYTTRVSVAELGDGTTLTMTFDAKPTTLVARLMTPISMMFNGAVRKALQQDLGDIKAAAEKP